MLRTCQRYDEALGAAKPQSEIGSELFVGNEIRASWDTYGTLAKRIPGHGGSVCESNAPATSEMPPNGFEDRESHRTPCASTNKLARAEHGLSTDDYTQP